MARAMRTTTFTEPKAVSDVLKSEFGTISREVVTIASGAGVLDVGTVLGKVTKGAASAEAKAGNTGDGTFTIDATTPVLAGAKPGVYTLRCIATASDGGTFRLEDPDGIVLGDFALDGGSVTVAEHIKGVIADGAADFAVGDGFDITVALGSGKWKKHVNGAVDGTERAEAVLLQKVDATSADQTAVICKRLAEVNRLALIWDDSVDSEAKKDAAIAQLAESNIIVRPGA